MPDNEDIFIINAVSGLFIEDNPTASLNVSGAVDTRWFWVDVPDTQKIFRPPEGQSSGRYEVCTCDAWSVIHVEPTVEGAAWHHCAHCHNTSFRPCIWKEVKGEGHA